ncbi:MAG: PIN domain-containing protein [Candidatus Diapherotrites archaeon]|nr:PIN domain-containing protein [Candidatus Diapherotrites archaeon]
MQLVADTNILVASMLRKGDTRKLLFSKKYEVFTPDETRIEILDHKEEFKQKGRMTEEQFQLALETELQNTTILPTEEYVSFKQKALSLCPQGHEDDWPFLALALKIDCALWSNDSALKKQSVIPVVTTTELLSKPEP